MNSFLEKIKRILGLSFQIAKTEFKLKNEGSYLGIFWYLLNPILMFGLLFLIFADRLGNNIPKYPLYLFLGVIMFNFFQNVISESTKLVTRDYRLIIKSANFPKVALLIGVLFKNLLSHFFELLLFIFMLLFFGVSISGIFYYFLLLIFFCIFIFGLSAMLVSLTVYFVDLDNIWNFGVKILWFATPIFYSIDAQVSLFYLNLFNPIYYFITAARDVIIYNIFPAAWIMWGIAGYSLVFFSVGIFLFNKLEIKFAEMI